MMTMKTMNSIEWLSPLASLDLWSSAPWSDGIQLDELPELESLAVRTWNSVYELIVVCAHTGDVLVRGGRYFPVFTRVQLLGSSAGGSFLKRLGIYPGLRLEFLIDGRQIVTSPIESARILSTAMCS
jgi:hypothetical protein